MNLYGIGIEDIHCVNLYGIDSHCVNLYDIEDIHCVNLYGIEILVINDIMINN